jgi:hypothetical protein
MHSETFSAVQTGHDRRPATLRRAMPSLAIEAKSAWKLASYAAPTQVCFCDSATYRF